ncbi:T9SS type A sorting domain-containing protein [Saccharicrinis sp. FJH2]|uniref:T9SS type A sorting domain-containing protein n=1 Tax=Saccharicrinis sp. FJH65 TaxID=3344659 RepID=UPI0035F318AB
MKKIFVLIVIAVVIFNIQAQRIEGVWDILSFENNYEYLKIDTSQQNIWQIGKPQKPLFDNAYDGTNAIVTDTINSYPVNNYSYFDLVLGEFNFSYHFRESIALEFKHKYNTDSLFDGGYLTISYDNGVSWTNIFNDTAGLYMVTPNILENDYYSCITTKLSNDEIGFSGNSNGWLTVDLSWYVLTCGLKSTRYNPQTVDTVIIRFNFISDNNDTGKEGWMIDDIKLYSVDVGDQIRNPDLNEVVIVYPNPSSDILNIRLKALFKKVQVDVYDLTGKMILNEIFNDKNEVALSVNNLLPGTYIIKVTPDNEISALKYFAVQ